MHINGSSPINGSSAEYSDEEMMVLGRFVSENIDYDELLRLAVWLAGDEDEVPYYAEELLAFIINRVRDDYI